MIAIIDYEVGNVAAVANMFLRIGKKAVVTKDPALIARADRLVLPGNGAFDTCMRNLRNTGLLPLLEQRVIEDQIPLLGICVGAQMLGHGSEEGTQPGLGWIDMKVRHLRQREGYPVPHMGWVYVSKEQQNHALVVGLNDDSRFYFVHSYYMEPSNKADVLLTAKYHDHFAAAVARRNIAGVQFHPEKSHRYGKYLLSAFSEW